MYFLKVFCIFLISCWLALYKSVYAYDSFILSGIIVCDSSHSSLPNAHIWNESQRNLYVSNSDGRFNIPITKGDTMVFSMLGYQPRVYRIKPHQISTGIEVRLSPLYYEIPEAKITWLGDYEDFKKNVIHLELPKTQFDALKENLWIKSNSVAIDASRNKEAKDRLENGGVLIKGFRIPYQEELDQMRLDEMKKLKERQDKVYEKYNAKLVSDITGLKGEQIIRFISYGNFTLEMLEQMSLYDIINLIKIKFEQYKQEYNLPDSLFHAPD